MSEPSAEPQTVSERGLASALGIAPASARKLAGSGAITPEICEGKIIRYDVEKVRAQLRREWSRRSNEIPS